MITVKDKLKMVELNALIESINYEEAVLKARMDFTIKQEKLMTDYCNTVIQTHRALHDNIMGIFNKQQKQLKCDVNEMKRSKICL